jgi:integrase
MARTVRDTNLETRAARGRLKPRHKPYYRLIDPGCHLGYYKGARGGAWIARFFLGNGQYAENKLGVADDVQDADGSTVLSFAQAQQKARAWFAVQGRLKTGEGHLGPYTVADAWRDYLAWFGAHRKSLKAMRASAEALILPALGGIDVAGLTTAKLRAWHEKLAATPPRLRSRNGGPVRHREMPDDPDAHRRRKATANRILTILKAALNHAWREGKAATDEPWRRVKPFHNVDAPRIRYITQAECQRLVNACEPDFRQLVQAALLTGCRYGELIALRVSDFDPDSKTLRIRRSKSGKPRHVHLGDEAAGFLARVAVSATVARTLGADRSGSLGTAHSGCLAREAEEGLARPLVPESGPMPAASRRGDELMFKREDGSPWRTSHQIRPLLRACEGAGVAPAISFHILRHTYASLLVMAGAPLQVVAHNLGHADTRMTERHYAHLASSYIADTIRALSPRLGVVEPTNVVPLRGH